MVHFYDLPPEIRQMIYEECLIVGEIYPYSLSDAYPGDAQTAQEKSGCDLPNLALLQVSKAIRLEAEPATYKRNHVHLGRTESSQRFFEQCLNTPERKLWLKSVTVRLDYDDLPRADRGDIRNTELLVPQDDILFHRRVYQKQERLARVLHHLHKNVLGVFICPQELFPLLDHCRLERLHVNLEGAFYRAGYCTMRSHAVFSFKRESVKSMPEVFVIDGAGEKDLTFEKLLQPLSSRGI